MISPETALKKFFNHDSFRSGQLDIINSILNGRNVVAILPTGAGKSVCYQIPAIISEKFSIVISPLIALMKDQVDSLNKQKKIAAFINSTMNYEESEEVLRNISYGKVKLLYVAPERLNNISFAERIKNLSPCFLFVDEAHCISEWGHNFRPSYSKINDFINFVSIPNVSAFTATATPEVVNDIVKNLNLKDPKLVVKGFERENLHLNVVVTKKKREKCIELINIHKTPAIIYTSSRKNAEEITEYLNLHRINCAYYHAGLAPEIRKKIQEDFLNDRLPIIAATNAFGMGIDKKDIRLIIHYNTTGSIENYYQEIGRAGRDGKSSFTYLLHDDFDINIQTFFLSTAHPDKELIQNIYAAICDYGQIAVGNISTKEIAINRDYITSYCKKKISSGLLHSALRHLENGGYIRQLSEFDGKISVQVLADKNRLKEYLKKTDNQLLTEVVLNLLRKYGSEIFNSKQYISLSRIAAKLNFEEYEIEEALITLDNLGLISFDKIIAKENIVLTSPRVKADQLKLDYKKINEHYLNLQNKLNKMIDYVFTSQCRFKYILEYFGENVDGYRCGKCDKCTENSFLPESTIDYIKEIIERTFRETEEQINQSKLIKILCGSSLNQKEAVYSTYSSLANYRKDDLKTIIQMMINEGTLKKESGMKGSLSLLESIKLKINHNDFMLDESVVTIDYEEDLELFNLLREARQKAAKKFMQAGYLICSDEILRETAKIKPKKDNELLTITGFSRRMFNKIGEDFLEIINSFYSNKNPEENVRTEIPQNIRETYNLLNQKYTLKDISSLRKLSEAVISMQIETLLEYDPSIEISYLFDKNDFNLIIDEIKKGLINLKELKEALPGRINYPLIRIAVAKYKVNSPLFSA